MDRRAGSRNARSPACRETRPSTRGSAFPAELKREIERGLDEEIAQREKSRAKTTASLSQTLERLARERAEVLHAYYADAIPLELLKAEQDRITTETARVEHELAARPQRS